MSFTLEIRVRPMAKKNLVGGVASDPPRLIVAVTAPAVDGKANKAVIAALAAAFEVKKRDVAIVFGELARDKRVVISGEIEKITERAQELMGTLL